MAYINWEQDHYKIKHIWTKIHAMNSSTCQFKIKIKTIRMKIPTCMSVPFNGRIL